jgi:PPIC-type PPIASE domain
LLYNILQVLMDQSWRKWVMGKSWLLCVLLGTLAWGQAAPGTPPPPQPAPGDAAAAIPDSAAVITVEGVCPPQPKTAATKGTAAKPAAPAKSAAADCKTVITKAEFEKIAKALSPGAPLNPQQKKVLASNLARFIPMSAAAKKKGLDKSEQFAETLKYAKMQILSSELVNNIQQEAAKVPQEDVAKYYKDNPEAFEQYVLERLYVPRNKQVEPEGKDADLKDVNPTEEQQKAKQAEQKAKAEQGEQEMTKLADSLRARAAAGEEFAKLQKEAFEAAGMKIESPTVTLPKMRRTGLPPAQASVFDLKVGDISPVISDSGGHYIYKVDSKDVMTLDQAQNEIHGKLQTERTRDMMDKVTGSIKTVQNEAYFGGGGPGMAPRMPNPRPAPANMPPAAQPQTPPPAQAPAQPPAAKPN